MKHLFVIILSLGLMACGIEDTDQASTQNVDNMAVIHTLYDAFAAGDVNAVLGTMADDIVWNEAENFPYADGNPYIGPEAVAAGVFARVGAEWEWWTVDIEKMISENENVVVLGRYNAKHIATGNRISAQFVHVWRIQSGKIAQFQQYADTLQVTQAMKPSE